MAQRRTHSSLDRLPKDLKEAITRMLVDNEWPAGWSGDRKGTPTYQDVVSYCFFKGFKVSASAAGRFGMRMRTLARMKQAGVITREVMSDLTDEKASATQKAVAEMLTAVAIEFISSHNSFDARQLRDVATAIRDCSAIAINSDKYAAAKIKEKAKAADEAISVLAARKQIAPEVLKQIREQVYGIIS